MPLLSVSCLESREVQEHLKAARSSGSNRGTLESAWWWEGMSHERLAEIRDGAWWGSLACQALISGLEAAVGTLSQPRASPTAFGSSPGGCSLVLPVLKEQGEAVSKDFCLAALHELFLSLHSNAWQLSFYKFLEPLIRAALWEAFAIYVWEFVWCLFKLKARAYFWGCFWPLSVKHGALYYGSKNP